MSPTVQSPPHRVAADLYAEVQQFYAWQMRLLDTLQLDGYAATFTPDGTVEHVSRGERAQGRDAMVAAMRAALPRYAGVAVRHWFDQLLVEPAGTDQDGAETVRVSYYALVSRTHQDGTITFEPTFTVTDVLVRRDGQLYARSRVIRRDTPPPIPTDV